MALSTLILLGYAAVLLAIGVAFSRRVHESRDFFVAGRGLGTGLLCSTLLAANIGGGSTVGATGLGYRDGLSAWWWVGSAGLGSVILAWSIGPRIWRVACEHNLYTVGDYLQLRFDGRVRSMAAAMLWIGSLSILAGQYIAVAWILNVTVGLSKVQGCLIAAVVSTAYFTAGGLHSSARVNVLQLLIKLTGFVTASVYLWYSTEGWKSLRETATLAGTDPSYWKFTGGSVTSVAHYIFLLAPSFIVSPGILQKVFGARTTRAVRAGVSLNAAGLFAFAIVPVFMGVVARQSFPNLENSELALPTLLLQFLPSWLGGLLLGAIFSAEVSAADAVLFMLTTSLSRDLYQAYLHPSSSDSQLMRFSRSTAVVCGATAGVIGILLPTVISALTIFYTLLTAALFLPILAGLYFPHVTAGPALAAMLSSSAICFGLEMATRGHGLWGVPSTIVGVGIGAAVLTLWPSRDGESAAGKI